MIKTKNNITLGFAVCGSFCTMEYAFARMKELKDKGYDIVPIMSEAAYSTDTRFGPASRFRELAAEISGNRIIRTIVDAEPIGPQKLLDALIIMPCTGNTLAKLANGVVDGPVTLAAKAHLRNERPLIIGISTNDALSSAAQNIGRLMNVKNIYFVPFGQDNSEKKPRSAVCDFTLTEESVAAALKGRQLQPIISYSG